MQCPSRISVSSPCKIIAERIKGTLSTFLTKEKHAFLQGRNILDAVATTQEGLFSIHAKKSDAVILKVDLCKAYDCMDWAFIRCLLAKIRLRSNMINWIMACVEGVNYAVIVNGFPSSFFLAQRGLRQGFPLSLLIFILALNSLSLHIKKAVKENRCLPLKISRNVSISHNLFVDGVIFFGILCRITWLCFYEILKNFQKASGLRINSSNSILYHNDIN